MEFMKAKGVRDIDPQIKIVKNRIFEVITTIFESHGLLPLETPVLERWETLSAKYGAGEGSDVLKETFKLTDQGERNLGLRFELTTSLARYLAENPQTKMPFKRYEMGRVFRDGPIKPGRYREFWQCDADIIGTDSLQADAELIAILYKGLTALGIKHVIKVNNRKILTGICEDANVTNTHDAIIAIDKFDKIGADGVRKELEERGISAEAAEVIVDKIQAPFSELSFNSETGKLGIEELNNVIELCKLYNVDVQIETTLARGQAYYTGTVIEAFAVDSHITSSIAGGGRYDNMIGDYMGNKQVPAIGISFGAEPILDILSSNQSNSVATFLFIPMKIEGANIVEALREKGLKVELAYGKKGLSKYLDYANALHIPFVIIHGQKEVDSGMFTVKNMVTGEQQSVTMDELCKLNN